MSRWLNMAEAVPRLLQRRALDGTYPRSTEAIIQAFESVAAHSNAHLRPWSGQVSATPDETGRRSNGTGLALLALPPSGYRVADFYPARPANRPTSFTCNA